MPSHISHFIFAHNALHKSTSEASVIIKKAGNFFYLGSQGPDIFYHNQRTRPVGIRMGTLLHKRNFGNFIAAMAEHLITKAAQNGSIKLEAAAYLLGFATHAELDRTTHPYIISKSGWVTEKNLFKDKYFRCHTFLERLLDVAALKSFKNIRLEDFDFFSNIYCGDTLPSEIIKMIDFSIQKTYPNQNYTNLQELRITNAYLDSIRFYALTDHRNPYLFKKALEKDRKENYKYKRIAVFHLENTGEELDPANLRHLEWQHPFMKNLTNFESYVDLMNISWNSIIPKLRVLADSIGLGSPTNLISNLSFSQTSNLFGNNNLYTNIDGGNDIPINSTPLPLQELFFKIYDSN